MGQVIEAELKLKYGKAIDEVAELKKELNEVKESFEANEKAAKDSEKGAKGFGNTLKAIGQAGGIIFLLKKAFEGLKAAINSNQQVADTFKVVIGTISQVFTEVANVLVGVYNNITATTDGFDALGKVLSGIFTLVLTPFKLVWDGIKLGIFQAQLAWEDSFFGDGDPETINRLNDSILETKQSMADTGNEAISAGKSIIKNFSEAVSEVGEAGSQIVEGISEISVKAIVESIKNNEQLKKSAAEARIENQGLIEQYDRQAEQQRQIRDDDTKNIADRIAANEKLKEELEEQKKVNA